MPNIEIRIQTVVLVALLLLLALAAPFLTGLIPEGQPTPVLAAAETPQEVVLTLADTPDAVGPTSEPDATPSQTDSTYMRAVQVQIKSLLAAQKAPPQPVAASAEVQVNTGTGANLNVRAAPGLDTAVLGGALQGEILPVQARSADALWVQVRWNGLVGWVYAPLTVPVAGEPATLPVAK